MKALGLVRDLEPGARAVLPTLRELRAMLPIAAVRDVVEHLQAGVPVVDVPASTRDPLDPTAAFPGGASLLSDGVWVWRRDLADFVGRYALGLDPDFVRRVRSNAAPVPADATEARAAYDRALAYDVPWPARLPPVVADETRRLIETWQRWGLPVRAPASEADRRTTEERLGVALPPDMWHFYSLVDGAADIGEGGFDEEYLIRLWPLAELELAHDRGDATLVFADVLLQSCVWELRLATSEVVAAGKVVAPTFAAFLRLLADGDPSLQ